ncbi:sensor histidine kinase [Clostridium butyricum]|uniref:sensor histidine kinase n=1 Tax=Clostridium butyricum TaxID=1492 RepID=UPI001A9A8CC9|nr:HAMP domain-containing sensor histidine kinase [Clostridium butyricum]MDB2156190.1 HAMP domain-containing sensor histidine kinase [Clostridium butyricum]
MQIKKINIQIERKVKDNLRQPIKLQLLNKNLTILGANINNIFSREENIRLKIIGHEKQMKDMIANIAHDLRTPLTSVKGYIQLLKKYVEDEKQMKMISVCLNHINELEHLINSFFELSYLEISKSDINNKKLNLTNIVSNMIADSVYQFEEHNIEVIYTGEDPVFIYADIENTKRIINNLIKNCLCHSNGNVKIDILKKEKIILSFRNPVSECIDIEVENLFNRFYVADKSRNKSTTGLGLSIVKLLIEDMGGKVEASLENNILEIKVQFEKYINNKLN